MYFLIIILPPFYNIASVDDPIKEGCSNTSISTINHSSWRFITHLEFVFCAAFQSGSTFVFIPLSNCFELFEVIKMDKNTNLQCTDIFLFYNQSRSLNRNYV